MPIENELQGEHHSNLIGLLETMNTHAWRLLLLEREICGLQDGDPNSEALGNALREYQDLSRELFGNVRGDRTPEWLKSRKDMHAFRQSRSTQSSAPGGEDATA